MDQGALKSIVESFGRSPIGLINFAILVSGVCYWLFGYKETLDSAACDIPEIRQFVATIAKKGEERDGALDIRLAGYDRSLAQIDTQIAKVKVNLQWLMRSTPAAHQPTPPPLMPADKLGENQGE